MPSPGVTDAVPCRRRPAWHDPHVSLTSSYQQILRRIHGRSIWWFVAASVALAFTPLSTPVLIVLYVVLAVFFWIPLAAATVSSFRSGYRGDRR